MFTLKCDALLVPALLCMFLLIHPTSASQDMVFQRLLERVERIRKEHDQHALQKLIADIESQRESLGADYADIVLELCRALTASKVVDPSQVTIRRELAAQALDDSGDKRLASEVRLLLILQSDPDYIQGKLRGADWQVVRLARTLRWLRTWERLSSAKRNLPEVIGPVLLNVAPPPGEGLRIPGVAPETIKDPARRKQYEEAIAQNNERARLHNLRREIENAESLYLHGARTYFINAYSQPPFNTPELEKTLEKYDFDSSSRLAIIEEVSKREARKLAQDAAIAKRIAENAPKPYVPPPVGVKVDAKMLAADPKLKAGITLNLTKKKLNVGEILDVLATATGLEITLGNPDYKDRLSPWLIVVKQAPASLVMEKMAEGVMDNGYWVKEENGYRLQGDLKPFPDKLRKVAQQAPEKRPPEGGDRFLLFFSLASLAAIGVVTLALWYLRKKRPAGPQA